MNHNLIEVTQQQNVTVSVEANSEDDALVLTHNQHDEAFTLSSPGPPPEKSRVISQLDEVC